MRSIIPSPGPPKVGLVILSLALLCTPAAASVESELAFHRGVVAFGQSDFDEAQQQFQKVVDEDPEDTAALQYLGLIAQKRGDAAGALALYDRAILVDPEDADLQLDRGIALLDAGRVPEAREAFERTVELAPDNSRAHLFTGITLYRMGEYNRATPYFDRAAELDAGLRDEARYYTGVSQALAGDAESAIASLGDASDAAGPLSPLAQSAQNLSRKLEPPTSEERRWRASFTAGMEWDDNPLVAGTGIGGVPVDTGKSDFRGVLRPSGSYNFWSSESFSVTGGYDGYLSFHIDETQVDLQIHNPWISGAYTLGKVRLGLRSDYSYTMNDLTEPFRHLIRTTPTINYRPADWALSQAFYQFSWKDFLDEQVSGTVLDRDGWRHVWGLNQFFLLPKEPFSYVRLGAYGDFNRSEGLEWAYDGMEGNLGAGYDFPWDLSLSWLFRFLYRSYNNGSLFSTPAPFDQVREDLRYQLTAELAKGITEHWVASVGGAFTWNQSNVDFYDYSRHIVGVYATYRF